MNEHEEVRVLVFVVYKPLGNWCDSHARDIASYLTRKIDMPLRTFFRTVHCVLRLSNIIKIADAEHGKFTNLLPIHDRSAPSRR